jgi:hypothetical protein
MPQRTVVIGLKPSDVQRAVQVVMDRDGPGALAFMTKVVQPQIEKALAPGGCRPVFELGGTEPQPAAVPPKSDDA